MYRLEHAEIETVTPELAGQWLVGFEYPYQRDIRDVQVEVLSNAMLKHEFTGNTIKLAHLNGMTYMVNGQHTMLAIVGSGTSQPLTIEHYHVESMEDAARIYFTTDLQNRRTLMDMYRATELPAHLDIRAAQLNAYGTAVRLVMADFNRHDASLISPYDLSHAMLEWQPALKHYLTCVDGSVLTTYRMMRKPVLALGLVTFRKVFDRAYNFWHPVAFNDNLESGDPRRTLHYYMLNAERMVGARELVMLRVVAKAWNAYYSGKQLTRLVTTATEPIHLLGTELTI
jgi:hypothetical protein